MKRKILLMLFLVGPMIAMAQKGQSNFLSSLEKLGYTEVEWTYYSAMKKTAGGLDKGWKVEEGETVKVNLKSPAIKQIQMAAKSGSKLQKSMAAFEMGAYKTKDNKVLPWIIIQSAFEKFPGYTHKAMASRMNFYIQKMESVNDDE